MPSLLIKFTIATFLGVSMATSPTTFLDEQLKFERVSAAYQEKEKTLRNSLAAQNIAIDKLNLLIVAIKDSDELDVYGKNAGDKSFKKLLSYRICARSGKLGPKTKKGDNQVPEGFYYIDRFNPTSNFHLSLGINYPNAADRRRNSDVPDLGGDIFIHGSCETIGCLPMTDNIIKEIYVLAAHARSNGQEKIPVYIFPFRMTAANLKSYKIQFDGGRDKSNQKLIAFWDNLSHGYDQFMQNKQALSFQVKEDGSYELTPL